MKNIILLIVVCSFFILSGCSGDNPVDLFELAQFEELQNNYEHAGQIYNEILEKYPGTELAGKAQERIDHLKNKGYEM